MSQTTTPLRHTKSSSSITLSGESMYASEAKHLATTTNSVEGELQRPRFPDPTPYSSSTNFAGDPDPLGAFHNRGQSTDLQSTESSGLANYPTTLRRRPSNSSGGHTLPSACVPSSVHPWGSNAWSTTSPPHSAVSSSFAHLPPPPPLPPATAVQDRALGPAVAPSAYRPLPNNDAVATPLHPPPPTSQLRRANSTVSYNSIWTGEGSDLHFGLDMSQFPRPPGQGFEQNAEGSFDNFHPGFNYPPVPTIPRHFIRPAASTVYEETERSNSRPESWATVQLLSNKNPFASTDDVSQILNDLNDLDDSGSSGRRRRTRLSSTSAWSTAQSTNLLGPQLHHRSSQPSPLRLTTSMPPLPPPNGPLPPTPQLTHSEENLESLANQAGSLLDRLTTAGRFSMKSLATTRGRAIPPLPPLPPEEVEWQQRHAGQGYTHQRGPSKSRSIRSVISGLSDRSRYKTHYSMGPSAGGTFTPLETDSPISEYKQKAEYPVSPLPLEKPPDSAHGWSRRSKIIACTLILIAIVGLAIGLGILLPQGNSSDKQSAPECSQSHMTGGLCDLDKSCFCVSNIPGRCDPVAQVLLDLIPRVNELFQVNVTAESLSVTLWDVLGESISPDCTSQALLVDVSPSLNASDEPERTEWARSAILYNFMQTQNLKSTAQMQSFVSNVDFGSVDGTSQEEFEYLGDGFLFNFGAMSMIPPPLSWRSESQVDSDQIDGLSSILDQTCDRIYSFASASSIQRAHALKQYWTMVLLLSEDQLSRFLSGLRAAAIILPFDEARMLNLLGNSDYTIPPPAACYPGLSPLEINNLNTVEQGAFGLPTIETGITETFESACFPDRPVYGVLDWLNLRQPFADSRANRPLQGISLASAAASRVTLHCGEQLVDISRAMGSSALQTLNLTSLDGDARNFGTIRYLDHIALQFLQSFSSIQLATTAALYVISSNGSPPEESSALWRDTNGLRDLPIIEVAVFGGVRGRDIQEVLSDFGQPDGSLFVGSEAANVLRNWVFQGNGGSIVWSTNATAIEVVRETSAREGEEVWGSIDAGDDEGAIMDRFAAAGLSSRG